MRRTTCWCVRSRNCTLVQTDRSKSCSRSPVEARSPTLRGSMDSLRKGTNQVESSADRKRSSCFRDYRDRLCCPFGRRAALVCIRRQPAAPPEQQVSCWTRNCVSHGNQIYRNRYGQESRGWMAANPSQLVNVCRVRFAPITTRVPPRRRNFSSRLGNWRSRRRRGGTNGSPSLVRELGGAGPTDGGGPWARMRPLHRNWANGS